MDLVLFLLVALCLTLGCFYYITKIYEWYSKRNKWTPLNEFISDLYKLQAKAIKRGQYEHAEALNLVIKSFYKEKAPKTMDGLIARRNLMNLEQEDDE